MRIPTLCIIKLVRGIGYEWLGIYLSQLPKRSSLLLLVFQISPFWILQDNNNSNTVVSWYWLFLHDQVSGCKWVSGLICHILQYGLSPWLCSRYKWNSGGYELIYYQLLVVWKGLTMIFDLLQLKLVLVVTNVRCVKQLENQPMQACWIEISMGASFVSGPPISSLRSLRYIVMVIKKWWRRYLPLLEVPSHVSGSYEIESTLWLEVYFTRCIPWYYLFTVDGCPVVSVQSIHDGQNWEVLGGAFTYTQTINLHFVHTEYVRDLVRLLWSYVGMNVTQLCLFGIDCTSTILWSPSQLGGREWIYTTTTAGIRNVQAVRVYIEVSTQQCLRKLDA